MNPEGGKISTQIMTTWRITDETERHLELVTAAASARNYTLAPSDSSRFIESRIRRGECELARKKCAECEANHLDGAINSRQLLSIDFLRSAFSE